MLADGQDPDALEARLAFHLHRLSLTGEPLREAMKGKAYLATALSQGRVTVEQPFIAELAVALNIAADELIRPLLEEEANEWSFYRTSADNKNAVWANISRFAADNNISLRSISDIIGMKFADVANSISGKRQKVFTLHHARKLSASRSPPLDPISLLPPFEPDQDRE